MTITFVCISPRHACFAQFYFYVPPRLSLVCHAWRIAAQRRLFSIRAIDTHKDLSKCRKLAHQSALGTSCVRVLVLVLYRKDYIQSGTGVTLKALLRSLPLFHKVIELRIETHKSQDDPLLAKFIGSLEALQTLEVSYTPWVRRTSISDSDSDSDAEGSGQEDCNSEDCSQGGCSQDWDITSSDSGDGSHSSISSYEDWEIVRGEITSIMKLPFPKLRTLSLHGVYWHEDASEPFSAPELSTLSIMYTYVIGENLSWILSSVKQYVCVYQACIARHANESEIFW